MPRRTEIWSYLLVTVVTVLIWLWAAGETRERRTLNYAQLEFNVPEPNAWLITDSRESVTLVIEGSRLAIERTETLLRDPLRITIPPFDGAQQIDLLERLRGHDDLRKTGARIVAADPVMLDLEMDRIVTVPATVKAILPPGAKTEGEITIEPAEIMVSMPENVQSNVAAATLTVEAVVDRAEFDRLEPDVAQTVEVKLRPPAGVTGGPDRPITLTPPRAQLSFTIRSRIRETVVPLVPVRISSSPEDIQAYVVEIDPRQLQNITVSAEEELIRRIEAGEVQVIAVLHLTTRELEERIKSKAVSAFQSLVPQPNGTIGYVPVSGSFGPHKDVPRIRLKITDR